MKSIQSRLLMTLLVSFVLVWSFMSVWLLLDLQNQLKQTLDQRLAASARMVAGLVVQLPAQQLSERPQPDAVGSTPQFQAAMLDGVACQVRRSDGELLLQTNSDMALVFENPTPGFSEREVDGINWRLFTYMQDDIMITTADRIQERQALNRGVLTAVAGPVLIALIAMLYATWWGIRVGLRPLHRLRHTLAQRDAKDLTPIELPMPHELAPLQHSLNQLLQRINELLAREKRFTSDAAHELRTPLTAIKTNVQLAQRLEPEDAKKVLREAEASISRMQRILEQLMLLARLDVDAELEIATPVQAGVVIAEALADISDLERVQIEGDTQVKLAVDASLLAMALRNLIDNALAYSSQEVMVCVTQRDQLVEMSVRDFGPGLNYQEKQQALDRFWRGGNGQGSGLGLSIVQQICHRLDADLKLSDANPGLRVALTCSSSPNKPFTCSKDRI